MEPTQGTSNVQMPDLHDIEFEYVRRNISKEDAQALLYDLPEEVYIIERRYDEDRRRLEFNAYLDDVATTVMSEFIDFMEANYPDCKLKFLHMHDYRAAHDKEDRDRYDEESEDLSKYEGYRTLP